MVRTFKWTESCKTYNIVVFNLKIFFTFFNFHFALMNVQYLIMELENNLSLFEY